LANLEADGGIKPTASLIDNQLHSERVNPDLSKCVSAASLQDLPDGVFVNIPAWGMHAYLLWKDQLLAWSNGGYQERRPRPANEEVTVITPRSTVAAILAGYLPEVHPSAANPG
jgi:hypothetical protein